MDAAAIANIGIARASFYSERLKNDAHRSRKECAANATLRGEMRFSGAGHQSDVNRLRTTKSTQQKIVSRRLSVEELTERGLIKDIATDFALLRLRALEYPARRVGGSINSLTNKRKTAMKRGYLIAVLALVTIGFVLPPSAVEAVATLRPYLHFPRGAAQGCEECYVPLLLMRYSLEAVAASGRDATIVLITTYERDSIWKIAWRASLVASDVSAADRTVRLRGRRYRYQEVSPTHALRLLEKAKGTMPIHRVTPIPDTMSLADLIAAFRVRKFGGRG